MARVILRDGRVAEFRAARPSDEDREALRQLFAAASDESRYLRFFRVVREVRQADIENMLLCDGGEQFTLLCTSDRRVIGVGTYTREGSDAAEVAFFVSDGDHGRGIGTLLLEHLAAVAWEYGIRRFEAEVLEENHRMQRVFLSSGYEVTSRAKQGTVHMALPLYQSERTKSLQDLRERHAVAASLVPFLDPRTIAVVGASRRAERLGQLLFRHVVEAAFAGTVYPVNHHAHSVTAIRAYPSVSDVPEPIDLAILIVPAEHVHAAAEDCVRAGVRAVMVVSSGFAEQSREGLQRQLALTRYLREAGCRLLGPNSLGIVNTDPRIQMNASLAPTMPKQGALAIASQSGALGIAILEYATRTGIGVASFISTGNRADISSNDLLQYWEDDVSARVIALYLESFGNPHRFSRIARRISKRKPIVAVKSARSSASQQVSDMNRTMLAADDAVVDALFQQTGIIRVDTLPELFDVAALLSVAPLPMGRRVAVVTNSAGGAVMAVDALIKEGLEFVGPVLDLGSEALAEGYRSVLPELLRDPSVDAILVVFIPIGLSEQDDVLSAIVEVMQEAGAAAAVEPGREVDASKPIVANFLVTQDSMVNLVETGSRQLPVYAFPEQAVRALARVTSYAEYRRQPVGRVPDLERIDTEAVGRVVHSGRDSSGKVNADGDSSAKWLPEADVAELLDGLGLSMWSGLAAGDAKSMVSGAQRPGALGGVESCATIHVVADPLFGPVITLTPASAEVRTEPRITRESRIAPLTDVDCQALIQTAWPYLQEHPTGDGLASFMADLLLRVSRLVDEVHVIGDCAFSVVRWVDESGTWRYAVHPVASKVSVQREVQPGLPYR